MTPGIKFLPRCAIVEYNTIVTWLLFGVAQVICNILQRHYNTEAMETVGVSVTLEVHSSDIRPNKK